MDKAAFRPKKTFRTKCSFSGLFLLGCVLPCATACTGNLSCSSPRLITYRPKDVERNTDGGVFVLPSGEEAELLLYGQDFTNETRLWLTDQGSCSGDLVNLHSLGPIHMHSDNGTRANITVQSSTRAGIYHFCISTSAAESAVKELQGDEDEPTLRLIIVDEDSKSKGLTFPLPVQIAFIVILVCLSGTFSGLNLGLMSLDPTTLKLVIESGSQKQRIYAKLIYCVRKYGNYLLCTLLLGNVLVNSTLTILLDSVLGSGLYAVASSTIVIVICGEIVPQAICSRHALTIGAYTIWLTWIFMFVTFPLSFPISIVLHFILGKEIGSVYTRDELLGLLKVTEDHHDIGRDEVQIISGALKFKEKTAEDVMTKFEYVYCLDIQCVLDFKTMREIYDSGFSRIPVFEDTKSNIVGVLYAKDLTFVDPDDETPLKQVMDFYNRELTSVYNDTKLNDLLEEFAGGKCHLALVNSVTQEGPGDPQLEVIGVVTLEDIVEEILQLEIVDETDRIMDNRSLKPRQRKQVDIGGLMDESHPHISSQQRLAIYQFLFTSINAFKSDKILPGILRRLLKQDIVRRYTLEEVQAHNYTLYRAGVSASSFTLVIEGYVEVEVGRDGMKFEAGPFHYFGVQALQTDSEYVPDFTVRPTSDCLVLVITRNQYSKACRATEFQQTKEQESSFSNQSNTRNHLSPCEATKSPRSTPSPSNLKSKSTSQLKSMATRKRRQSNKKSGKVEVQLLLEESLSEEDGEGGEESDEVFPTPTTRSLDALRDASGGRTDLSHPVTVEVEMHSAGEETQCRTSSPILVEEPPSVSSSQL